jgi:hypothetical protein
LYDDNTNPTIYFFIARKVRRPGEKMRSLFDVFAAIAADERDHTTAMSACLDTDATFQSPSLERRILVGVAAVAFATYMLSTNGELDVSVLDSADTAVSMASDSSVVSELAAAAAGMVGWAKDTAYDDEVQIESVGEAVMESGEAMQRFWYSMLRIFPRLL